jgi:hypothetical protein
MSIATAFLLNLPLQGSCSNPTLHAKGEKVSISKHFFIFSFIPLWINHLKLFGKRKAGGGIETVLKENAYSVKLITKSM